MLESEFTRRFVEEVLAEAKARKIRVSDLEMKIGVFDGFFRGRRRKPALGISVDIVAAAGTALGIGPQQLFEQVLGLQTTAEGYLRSILGHARLRDAALLRLEGAARDLVALLGNEPSGGAVAEPRAPGDFSALLQAIQRIEPRYLARRLRRSRRYHRVDFLEAFLDYIDELRLDDIRLAAHLAQVVGSELIPKLEVCPRKRSALLSVALGIFASARQQGGALASAARSLLCAAGLARSIESPIAVAGVLRRSAYFALASGHIDHSLKFLNGAQVTYWKHSEEVSLARALLEEGIVLQQAGRSREAIARIERAMPTLSRSRKRKCRHRVAANHALALAYSDLGDLAKARENLNTAKGSLGQDGNLACAMMLWLSADLSRKEGDLISAERKLRRTVRILGEKGVIEEIFAILELSKVLVAQGNTEAVGRLAGGIGRILERLAEWPAAQGLWMDFARASLEGAATVALICKVQEGIKREARRETRLAVGLG